MPKAVRLTLEFAGPAPPRVVATRALDKQVPSSDSLAPYTERSGFWVDVVDAGRRALYRSVTGDPRDSAEAPADDPGQSMTHIPSTARELFSIVVPDLPGAARIEVWASDGDSRAKVVLSIAFPRDGG